MKRSVFSLFVIIVSILLIGSPCPAQARYIGDEVQSMLNKMSMSFDKEDVDGVVKFALPSATVHYLDGTTLTADQWKAEVRKSFAKMEKEKTEFKVITAEATNGNGTATYTAKHEYILSDDKLHQYCKIRKWKIDLTKTIEGWRITRFEQLSEEMTCDGQPYKGSAEAEKF